MVALGSGIFEILNIYRTIGIILDAGCVVIFDFLCVAG
jgi:hypothetical protein